MLSALRKAGQVNFGPVTLSSNASLIGLNQAQSLLSQNIPSLRIVNGTFLMPGDPRSKTEVYKNERIPTARFFDIDEIADKSLNLPHMVPSLADWKKHMQRLDIGANDAIICYDDHSIIGASRVWWTFKIFGVKNVWILNGHMNNWKKEGYATEKGEPVWQKSIKPRPAEDFGFTYNSNFVKSMNDIRNWMTNPDKKHELVDARAPGRFAGTEPDPRGLRSGHIPGAKNVFFKSLLNEDGTFKSDEELIKVIGNSGKKIYPGKSLTRKLGVDLGKELMFSCGSGVTACVTLAAFYQVGLQKNSLYDGSWSEWAQELANPVGVKAAP